VTLAADPSGPFARATFLLTDIEGSTTLWERSPDAMRGALARHDAILREGIEAHGGQVFKAAGDAFFATFVESKDAVAAALALQRALAAERWPDEAPIKVRMALHAGEATRRGGDWFGPPLNVAARLLSVCRGAQTLLSATIDAPLDGAVAAEARIESHGDYRMKGVEAPVEVRELGFRGRAAFMPPVDTDAVYRVVRVGELWQPVRTIRHNLPAEVDRFVGRSLELSAFARQLEAGVRLTTVLGAGGTGKTRFVRRYASAWLGDWPGGVCFCDLSDARTLDGLLGAVAVALDIPLSNADSVVQLGHAIAARGRCLVVLDNFEQLLDHAGATVGRWLERAPHARFVATSRERLRLAGEQVFPLEPLPLDDDAIDLFVARAQARRPGFALSAGNREAVGRIVRLLDGLPLAIELAAARIGVLSPAQMVERMHDRFALLGGARGVVARQATLRAAIDWSWDLLAPWEQAALAQCAVFEGGFSLHAAERVIDLSSWPDAPAAMDAVQALVDKSLLRSWVPAGEQRYELDEMYFGMYVSIHEYAAAKLRASGAAAERAAEERHGRCFAEFGTDEAIQALFAHDGLRRRRALALELDNTVAACRRAIARDDAGIAVATYRAAWEVLDLRGPFSSAAALGKEVEAMGCLDGERRVLVLLTQARTMQRGGQSALIEAVLNEALALARRHGDRQKEAIARSILGAALCTLGRMGEARAELESALALQRELDDPRVEGSILTNLGRIEVDQGQVDAGRAHYERALRLQRELGNRIEEASVLSQIAVVMGESGRLPEAQAYFEESLAISRELGDRVAEGETLNNLGCLYHDQRRFDEARAAYKAALATHREVGNRRFEGYALGDLGRLQVEQRQFVAARASLEQSLAIARETKNRRIEGSELRNLGKLLMLQGHSDDAARATFREAETVLREVNDKHYLGLVLCGRGELERRAGDAAAARGSCAEAKRLADEIHAGPDSQLGRGIVALESALSGVNGGDAA
jgi:predicted ATPase/class 3 adenylate cyclase/Tfp pilus assembly protein PilF